MGCLCTTVKWVVGLAVLGGIVWFFVWLFTRGRSWHINVGVESATLARFDLDANSTLRYNLTVAVSVRNANRGANVYYDKVNAAALYNGTMFGSAGVPYFSQGRKTTTVIHPAFQGQASLPGGGGSVLARFNREKREGIHSIDLRLYMDIRIEWTSSSEYGTETHRRGYALVADCALRVPRLDGAAGARAAFNTTVCSVRF